MKLSDRIPHDFGSFSSCFQGDIRKASDIFYFAERTTCDIPECTDKFGESRVQVRASKRSCPSSSNLQSVQIYLKFPEGEGTLSKTIQPPLAPTSTNSLPQLFSCKHRQELIDMPYLFSYSL